MDTGGFYRRGSSFTSSLVAESTAPITPPVTPFGGGHRSQRGSFLNCQPNPDGFLISQKLDSLMVDFAEQRQLLSETKIECME